MVNNPSLEHGVFGNGRVLGLVSPRASVDWLCLPRFDSGSVFGRLLDREKGGSLGVRCGGVEREGALSYLTNTNVLRGVFDDGQGNRWEVIDFAPWLPRGLDHEAPLEMVRMIRPLSGVPRLSVCLQPRPDYATVVPEATLQRGGIEFHGGSHTFYAVSNIPAPVLIEGREFSLREPVFLVFGCGRAPGGWDLASVQHALSETTSAWRHWVKTCSLPRFAVDKVLRSALCLRLHVSHDTGAIIAAATTSVPEAMGTERTWDYRYCWLRDAAFVVEALRRLGHLTEGERFLRYLREVAEGGPLQPLYGIGGERSLEERFLPHLAGFGGNGHVRIGNAASIQQQNDLNGELILCLETLLTDPRIVHDKPDSYLPLIERLVEDAIRLAPLPDTGIWEFRSMLRPYTFSRAMCWVAIERGARLAAALGRPDLARRWGPIARRERDEVLRRAYNQELGFFTQALDGTFPDASNLLLPTIGLIDGRDPRFLSTLDRYGERLVQGGLMLRYMNVDDFGDTTSAFTICSFWWAEALAQAGRIDEAVEVFTRVASYANPLGLFSEDIDPATGSLLGNFPQAYTHVGLIHAATTIAELSAERDGRSRAWA